MEKNDKILRQFFRFIDLSCLFFLPFISLWLRETSHLEFRHELFSDVNVLVMFLCINSCCFGGYFAFKINVGFSYFFSLIDALRVLLFSLFMVFLWEILIFTYFQQLNFPRSVPLIYGLVLIVSLLLNRIFYRILYDKMHIHLSKLKSNINFVAKDIKPKRVIVVGLDKFSINIVKALFYMSPKSVEVVAILQIGKHSHDYRLSNVRMVRSVDSLPWEICELQDRGIHIDEIWISDNINHSIIEVEKELNDLKLSYAITIKTIGEAFGFNDKIYLSKKQYIPSPYDYLYSNSYLYLKRIFDIIFSLVLIIVLFPFFLIAAALLYYSIGRPLLFWQERLGKDGERILIYKLRTLLPSTSKAGHPLNIDQRSTQIAKFARKIRIDEYPQLLAVLFGNLSGIGPRPLLQKEQPEAIKFRLLVKPGITGWAQVNGGELLDIDEKNALDCWYVFNIGLWLDIYIVLKTFLVLIFGVRRNEKHIEKAKIWINNYKEDIS